ncbi:hypothetical protein [Streptomyces malaysiensis]|uniref:hypothetical protein n=1 Tax=Streptomyces malaysiensis TaxID=92644 RepID=UPI001FCC333B|nr:hypothetical protein [Streptomyces malaysiensis]
MVQQPQRTLFRKAYGGRGNGPATAEFGGHMMDPGAFAGAEQSLPVSTSSVETAALSGAAIQWVARTPGQNRLPVSSRLGPRR